ncbi:hypothetical protein HK096_007884 [Nowakowskiella sp. JEL0078]|nr:hypothetical protein HK096_007884 [Nowakowskiella sp. JEL0078]
MITPHLTLPIIDISPFLPNAADILDAETLQMSKLAMAELVDAACRDVGFFYLVGHGVSEETRKQVLDLGRKFFALDLDEKEKISITKSDFARGYQKLGQNVTKYEKDWHEAIDFYSPVDPSHPLMERKIRTLTGENQFPEVPKNFREVYTQYVETMKGIGFAVMRCIALGLKLPESIIGYPPISTSTEGAVGKSCGEHSDYGCLTILNTDDTPDALQVFSKSGEWITANPIPGAFVINIGDMLNIWTNDIYQSTLHRVIHTKSNYRVSLPFFFEPNFDAIIEPLEVCIAKESENDSNLQKKKYRPVVFGDHIVGKVASNFDVKESHEGSEPVAKRLDLKSLQLDA